MTTGPRRARPDEQTSRRAATFDAIVNAARTLLAQGQEPTVRGVASQMGASPAGLYRYVANIDELRDLVAVAIDTSLAADIAGAAETASDDTVRWLVAWVRLRRWALDNQQEFRLLLSRPRSGETSLRELSDTFLGQCLRGLTADRDLRLPSVPPATEAVLAGLPGADAECWPTSLRWLHARVLASLHGVIALEATGYLDPALVSGAAVFRATMIEWLARLVRADELGGLLTALDHELTR